ncbi:hypothetical protein [Lysobacter gummosus]|uniref:hypothetical protein n=1 Tax=Lysobacter gummosus TaxID=262324 RepID=UPI00362E4D76
MIECDGHAGLLSMARLHRRRAPPSLSPRSRTIGPEAVRGRCDCARPAANFAAAFETQADA